MSSALIDAVAALALQPRSRRWTSLTYCVLDAVWSLGAHSDAVVVPVVYRVATSAGDIQPLAPSTAMPDDPFPVIQFLAACPTEQQLARITNAQRTSPRGGITKAAATLSYARAFSDAGVTALEHATTLAGDEKAFTALNRALAQVPGEGSDAVRRSYLWMLIGDDQQVKPDRMVLRWLRRHGVSVTAAAATGLLRDVAAQLSTPDEPVTPWMIDHAIWLVERGGLHIPDPDPDRGRSE